MKMVLLSSPLFFRVSIQRNIRNCCTHVHPIVHLKFAICCTGWYAFRTPHIHLEAHAGGKTVHVAQLYFQNSLNKRITRLSPYRQRATVAVKNEDDYIFRRDNGDTTTIYNIRPIDGKRMSRGMKGEMVLGIDPNHDSPKALHGRSQ